MSNDRVFVERIGKEMEDGCICCNKVDTAKQTVFDCGRWQEIRGELILDTLISFNDRIH